MIQEHTRTIDGEEFSYTPMTLKPARELFDMLMQTGGPIVAGFLAGLDRSELSLDSDIGMNAETMALPAISNLVRDISAAMSPELHRDVAERIHKRVFWTDSEGKKIRLTEAADHLFAQKIMLEFKVIGFALEVQYADFFTYIKRSLAAMAAAKAAKKEKPAEVPKPEK